jgi:small conductance mechanosensitive channel
MNPEAVDLENMNVTLMTLRDQAILFVPRIVTGLVIFIVFWLVSRVLRRVIRRIGKDTELPEEVCSLASDVTGIIIVGLGLITALGTVGIDVGGMIAGLGLTGFALAFALQDIVSSTLAGILLLMYRPFSVNHRIKVGSNEGIVSDINLRYTRLDNEGNAILIPNSSLFKEAIIVYDDAENPRPVKVTSTDGGGLSAPDGPTMPAATLKPPAPEDIGEPALDASDMEAAQ